MIDKLQKVTLDNGRIVTGQTAWWYKQQPRTEFHSHLFCIHGRNLLTGCNACKEEADDNLEV